MNRSNEMCKESWWKALRKRIKKRDGNRCRFINCTYPTDDLRVCHIKSRREYPQFARMPDNCLTLCAYHDALYGEELSTPRVKKMWYNGKRNKGFQLCEHPFIYGQVKKHGTITNTQV